MKAGIVAVVAACLACPVAIAAQGPGAPEHVSRTVPVSIVNPRPCISVRGSHARILLPTNRLIELSRSGKRSYQSEEERLAFIAGTRATALLAMASQGKDASGCESVDLEHAGRERDAVYLVGSLIESGQAVVIRDGSTKAETSIVVHDYNGALSGFQSFQFVDGETFFSYPTWIT